MTDHPLRLLLAGGGTVLADGQGRQFDPAARRWEPWRGPWSGGAAIDLQDAVHWLQRDPARRCRVPIAVLGGREAPRPILELAEHAGRRLAELGLVLLTGGKTGVMEAACRACEAAGGLNVALLPDEEAAGANPHVGVPLATGIGFARNALIARAGLVLIAIGGGPGTTSEMALGLQFGRLVLALPGAPRVEGVTRCAGWEEAETALLREVLALPREAQASPPPEPRPDRPPAG